MKKIAITFIFLFTSTFLFAQLKNTFDQSIFNINKNYCSKVKDQGNSGTCWSFASISFIESEIKKAHNIDVDLAEWFIVRNIYPEKIRNYIRTEGNIHLTPGGQIQDVLWVIKHKGIVTEDVFKGPLVHEKFFDSEVLDSLVVKFSKELKWDKYGLISKDWEINFDKLLDENLGKKPSEFNYKNKTYTPKSFSKYLKIDTDDYIQITSFNHHPFYKSFALESKYNWSYGSYLNLPLDEFMKSLDNALKKGYTVALNTDVSEKTFKPYMSGLIDVVHTSVNQSLRQELFENGKSRIDHVMHIIGSATKKDGKKYYITKNSWGKIGPLKGFMYISENYIKSKAMSLVMNKKGLPRKVKRKLR